MSCVIYQYQILELFRRDIVFSQEFRDCGGDFKIPAFPVWLYFGKCFVIHELGGFFPCKSLYKCLLLFMHRQCSWHTETELHNITSPSYIFL